MARTVISECPNAMTLAKYASGVLDEESAGELLEHVDECERCQKLIDDMARRDDSLIDAIRRPAPGTEPVDEPGLARLISKARDIDTQRDVSNQTVKLKPREETIALDEFVECLRKSRLFNPSEVDLLAESIKPGDSDSFARELITRKKLTQFQARALLRGRWKGLVLGNYVVLEKLGEGGMGYVFKARHRRMGRIVCLKVLHSTGRKSPEIVQRFRREAKTVAAMNHPNIVVAHDADEADGIQFLVMEFIEGRDLARLISATGPLPVESAVPIVLQVAQALSYAHEKGIIHRDIKPHNLLLAPASETDAEVDEHSGVIKILDMGLARFDSYLAQQSDATTHASMTNTGVIMGTVDYMSPEQALNSRNADNRSDIYSLGCTMYYLLTGRVMFEGETLMEKLIAHREFPPPSLRQTVEGVPEWLDAIFQKMVTKNVGTRYDSMSDVVEDMESLLAGQPPQHALEDIAAARTSPPRWSVRRGFVLAAVVLMATGFWFSRSALLSSFAERGVWSTVTTLAQTGSLTVPPDGQVDGSTAGTFTPPVATASDKSVLVVIPHDWFIEEDYSFLTSTLRNRGIPMKVASSTSGLAKSKHNILEPVEIDIALDSANVMDLLDFDAMIFCGGNVGEFNGDQPAAAVTRAAIDEFLRGPRVVGSVGSGRNILDNAFSYLSHLDIHTCTAIKRNNVEYIHPQTCEGSIVRANEHKQARHLVETVFDHLLYEGHPDTMANGGSGRVLVVLSWNELNVSDYTSVMEQLEQRNLQFDIASSQTGELKRKGLEQPIEIDKTIHDVLAKDYDAIIFCGGNKVIYEFGHKNQRNKEATMRVVGDFLTDGRIVASIEQGRDAIRDTGFMNQMEIEQANGLRIGRRHDMSGTVIEADTDEFVPALFDRLMVPPQTGDEST